MKSFPRRTLAPALALIAAAGVPACGGDDGRVTVVLEETIARVKAAQGSKDDFEVGAQCLAAASTLDSPEVKTAVAAGGKAKALADELIALCKTPDPAPGSATAAPLLPPVDDSEDPPASAPTGATAAPAAGAVPAAAAAAEERRDAPKAAPKKTEPDGATSAPDPK